MRIVAPTAATHRTRSSTSTIDYFVLSDCLQERVRSISVETDFPLSPHSPVRLVCSAGLQAWKPVLETPTKIPTERPLGPAKEPSSWEHLREAIAATEARLTAERWTQREQAGMLDVIYSDFVDAFEKEVCAQTDTQRRRRSNRGRVPKVRWVTSWVSAATHMQSWHSLDRKSTL